MDLVPGLTLRERPADLPILGIALVGVTEAPRARRLREALKEFLGKSLQDLLRQAEAGESTAGKGDIQSPLGLPRFSIGARGPPGRRYLWDDLREPCPGRGAVLEVEKMVAGARQMAKTAQDD